jgi:hypothetical protein
MERLTLVQPRHVYAPQQGNGHIHLSAPLVTAAARMIDSGVDPSAITMVDENFGDAPTGEIEADVVGINLVGAPYIPVAIKMISDRVRSGARVLLGGQIIDSLSIEEFEQLFCSIRPDVEVVNGNEEIARYSPEEEVSSIPVWDLIPDEQMREYLSHEFSFYLSQGCKYGCRSCQAKKGRKEKYRNMEVMREDLEYLILRAKSLGLLEFKMYLSNLDMLQNEEKIMEFGKIVGQLRKKHDFHINFRGLAGIESYYFSHLYTIMCLRDVGLTSIAYGIDGNPSVWNSILKNQNQGNEGGYKRCESAIAGTSQMGVTPEILMVFGYDQDTRESLQEACDFVTDMTEKYGAVPRPHVAKTIIPGADAWKAPENREIVSHLLENPERFKDLDYLALASDVTHEDELGVLVNEFATKVAELMGGDPWGELVLPSSPEMNVGKYDR